MCIANREAISNIENRGIDVQPSQTVDRALRILEMFTLNRRSWTLTALSEQMGIHRSIVFRLLQALESHGFLIKDMRTKEYTLGYRLLELGHLVEIQNELVRAATPVLHELARAVGETAFLNVVDGRDWVVCLGRVESPHSVRFTMSPGTRSWLHAGATSKVLLAHLPEHRIDRYLARELPRFTPATVTDPVELRRQIGEIRRAGMAVSSEELDLDVAAVAVPLLDAADVLLGGLSFAGPMHRCPPERLKEMGQTLKSAACRLSEALGSSSYSGSDS